MTTDELKKEKRRVEAAIEVLLLDLVRMTGAKALDLSIEMRSTSSPSGWTVDGASAQIQLIF